MAEGRGQQSHPLRALFSELSDCVIRLDAQLRFLEINAAVERALGRRESEVVGKTFHELGASPEEAAEWQEQAARALESGRIIRGELRCMSMAGREPLATTFFPEPGVDGAFVSVLALARVSPGGEFRAGAVRKARGTGQFERLHALTSAFSAARTCASVATILVDQGCAALEADGGVVLLVNSFRELGVAASAGMAGDVASKWSAASHPFADSDWRREAAFYESTEAFSIAWPQLAGAPTQADRAIAFAPFEEGGKPLGFAAFVFGRPRVFSAEDRSLALAVTTACAQALARASDFEASESARKRAERENLVKDEFLATMSHELRTPLAAILGWSSLLQRKEHDRPSLLRALAVIERNARAQARLIEDVLDVARIVAGKFRVDLEKVHIEDVVMAALDSVRPLAEAKNVSLVAHLSAPVLVEGDFHRLEQAFWNLVSNAVKFTPAGGQVDVSAVTSSLGVSISIKDSGEGISHELLPVIFDRFRQQDSSSTRQHAGLGLGLSIVRQLLELHGGTVRATSDGVGRGACFVVELPTIAPEGDARTKLRRGLSQSDGRLTPLPELRGVRVLAVDNEPDARDVVSAVLVQCGAEVVSASNVDDALVHLSAELPHILVCDIGMPRSDGFSLLRQVRELAPGRGGTTPAIALTAYAGAEDAQRALDAGFQLHLAKPVDARELASAVARLAGDARRGSTRPPTPAKQGRTMVLRETFAAALPHCLENTDFSELGTKYEGKVRDNYTRGDRRFIVVTDRISAFDRVLGAVPFKGQMLNRLAAFWFEKTKHVVPNHVLGVPDPNVLECVECSPILVEMVVRAYATGTTSTSLWTHYERGERLFCGHVLPEGLRKHERLPSPILTPTTKAPKGEHDVSGSREEILATGKVTAFDFDEAAAAAMKLFAAGQALCAERGLILVDTKYEFGRTPEGKLVVIDEVHTPDSSRFWKADTYAERFATGRDPEPLDKDFVRRWYTAQGYRGDGEPPAMPDDVRVGAAERYAEAYEQITGAPFVPNAEPPLARIARNLGLSPAGGTP